MKCSESVAMGDGRELWYITNDFMIRSFVDEYCLTVKGG
jgi:hypothetical protein